MSPTDDNPTESEDAPERPGHEEVDVNPARLAMWGGILLAGTAVCALLAAVGYAAAKGITFAEVFSPEPQIVERPLPPEPRLERDPYALLRATEEQALSRLQGWEWISREQGTARIPIDRAMELVVQKYEQGGQPPGTGQGTDAGAPDAGTPDAGTPDAGATDRDGGGGGTDTQ